MKGITAETVCEQFTISQKWAPHIVKAHNVQVLWLKSRNSEVWLERRTNYTRSSAVMSMVGYLLGLGDRHPSNLMLDRYSGKLVHIDFGDCFEASMTREKYPEKVPFRLTRMMVKAMEVSGTEGSFRVACDLTMNVLREEKVSVMAMLEAFVFDPLINWRLLHPRALQGTAAAVAAPPTEADTSLLSSEATPAQSEGAGNANDATYGVEQLRQVCAFSPLLTVALHEILALQGTVGGGGRGAAHRIPDALSYSSEATPAQSEGAGNVNETMYGVEQLHQSVPSHH
jgi:hypothetical protein